MGAVNEGDIVSYFKEYGNGIGSILENQAIISFTVIVLFVLSIINMFIASIGKKEEITVPKAPIGVPAEAMYEQPVEEAVFEEPVFTEPVEAPSFEQPVYEQPVEEPVFEQPAEEPVYEQPAEEVVTPVAEQDAVPKVQNSLNNAQRFSVGGDL